jgi:hypothetical protein
VLEEHAEHVEAHGADSFDEVARFLQALFGANLGEQLKQGTLGYRDEGAIRLFWQGLEAEVLGKGVREEVA